MTDMRKHTTFQALEHFKNKHCFTSKEAKARGISSSMLSYCAKKGKLRRVHHGLYQHVKHRSTAFRWEDLIEDVHSVPRGVVCLISALAIYEITEEIPRQHWIAVPNSTSVRPSRQVRIVRLRDAELGRTEIMLEGVKTPIFDQERTIVDAFRLLSPEIAIKALKMALAKSGRNKLNIPKLEKYAKKLRFDIAPYLLTATT